MLKKHIKEIDLSKIFGSNCRTRLLEKFFLEYESGNNHGFHMRGLSRELGEQINSIKRELDNLKNLGILSSREELKKKFFFVNNKFYLLNEFINIFLKTYNPIEKIKNYFKNKNKLELIIINNAVKTKLIKKEKNILDIFLIGEINKKDLSDFLGTIFYGRKIKFAVISKEDFFHRLEFGDKLIKHILMEEGNIFLKDKLKIKDSINF